MNLQEFERKLGELSDNACIVLYTIIRFLLEHYKYSRIQYPTYKHLHKLIAAAQYTEDPEDTIFQIKPLAIRPFKFIIKYYGVISNDILKVLREELKEYGLVEIEKVGKIRYVKLSKDLVRMLIRDEVFVIDAIIKRLITKTQGDEYLRLIMRIERFIKKLIGKFNDNINEFNLEFERSIGLYIKYAFLEKTIEDVLKMRESVLGK